MKSLYCQYIKEREDFEILEDENGFATYKISGAECYIRDIFVKPEFRKMNLASKYADEIAIIAKNQGCTHLSGTVSPAANGATQSVQVLLSYGFKIARSTNDLIIFVKEIK